MHFEWYDLVQPIISYGMAKMAQISIFWSILVKSAILGKFVIYLSQEWMHQITSFKMQFDTRFFSLEGGGNKIFWSVCGNILIIQDTSFAVLYLK